MPAIRDLLILDDLDLTYLRGRSKFKVGQPFRLAWNYGRWHRRLTVPIGSDTNGASIPRILQSLLPVLNDCLIAGAVHDYLASSPAPASAAPRPTRWRARSSAGATSPPGARGYLARRPRLGWVKWHGDVDSREIPADGRLDPAREAPAYRAAERCAARPARTADGRATSSNTSSLPAVAWARSAATRRARTARCGGCSLLRRPTGLAPRDQPKAGPREAQPARGQA